jgi:microcystin-dependent protein
VSEPFIAEIRIFAGNFAPRGWAFCNGQLLPIAQNTALFSLIGTTYGGDGRTTTGLPNLQGRMPMHPGRGPGLTSRRLGEKGGFETVTLTEAQMSSHNHSLVAAAIPGNDNDPTDDGYWATSVGANSYATANNLVQMAAEALPAAGGSQAHNNRQSYLTLNFIIALIGIYPSRS